MKEGLSATRLNAQRKPDERSFITVKPWHVASWSHCAFTWSGGSCHGPAVLSQKMFVADSKVQIAVLV
jgi:hypothetical protein